MVAACFIHADIHCGESRREYAARLGLHRHCSHRVRNLCRFADTRPLHQLTAGLVTSVPDP